MNRAGVFLTVLCISRERDKLLRFQIGVIQLLSVCVRLSSRRVVARAIFARALHEGTRVQLLGRLFGFVFLVLEV